MSATAFLRHRRAVAAQIVQKAVKRAPKKLAAIMEQRGILPEDLPNLHKSNDVLSIADQVAKEITDQPELDDLEEIGTFETGDRAAVHSPDVRADQFEDKLQHSCQETVGVGNMHD